MKSMNKFLSVLLIVALMFSLIPPMQIFALGTPQIEIINLYAPDSTMYVNGDYEDVLLDSALSYVTRMTSSKITLKGNFYNYDPSQVEKFYYTVTNVRNDGNTTVTYDKNPAIVTGDDTFEFQNVVLNEGLNKIVVYSEQGEVKSRPGWAYYYPVTTITDLKVNDIPFVDGMIVPEDPLNEGTSLIITGTAPNANSVFIQVVGDATPYTGYYNSQTGYFQFKVDSINSSKLADIKLNGGDQQFEIIANNDTQKITLTRDFIYNDGTPFIFENQVANVDATGNPEQLYDLVTQPVIEGDTNEVYLEGSIKVDIDPATPGELLYDDVTISVPNSTSVDKVTFVFDTLAWVPSGNPNLTATITEDVTRSTAQYKIYNYTINRILINDLEREQTITTVFSNTNGSLTKPFNKFDYINTSIPYIAQVKFRDTQIPLVDDTQVIELPIILEVVPNTTSAGFDSVNIYSDTTNLITDVVQISATEYQINWLPEGAHNITFVPVISGTEYPVGAITRSINYIPMQYVIVDSLYNGQIFYSKSTLDNITGRLVNVPANNDIYVYLGEKELGNKLDSSDPLTDDDGFTVLADGSFIIEGNDGNFTTLKDGSGNILSTVSVAEGKNTLTFVIKDENNELVSESKWTFYVFSTKAPQVDMDITTSIKDKFYTSAELLPGQYSTREKTVVFDGAFVESSKITVNVYRQDENGNQVKKTGIFEYSAFGDTKNFNSQNDEMLISVSTINATNGTADGNFDLTIDLSYLGTTTIEVQVTNASGIVSSKMFEILRDPLPYEILYPNLERTNVINSNYIRIEMIAEGADKVVFKEGEAKKADIYDRLGNQVEGFVYEVLNLKKGKNTIKFTVVRGEQELDGELEVFNANTVIEGATYKSPIKNKMKIFDGLIELEFPKGTMLRRNDDSTINPYLSDDRQILFGIAEDTYGRVDKYLHPIYSELSQDRDENGDQIDNFYPSIYTEAKIGKNYLEEPTNRFREAGPLIWIDGGVLEANASDIDDIVYGSGKLPYDDLHLPDTATFDNDDYVFYNRQFEDQIVPTQAGTITLEYNESIREDAWPYLTIYHYVYNEDKDTYEWDNIGGVVNPKKRTITAQIETFGYFRVMYMNQSFDDVIAHSWARHDLDTLYSKGIMINKYSDQFVPEENISRGEFVTLLVKAYELPLDYEGDGTFYDVYENPRFDGNALWEYKYIETAARYGIIRGQLEGTFAPNEPITRQDASVMIARTADLKTSSVTDEKAMDRTMKNLEKLFTDGSLIDVYAAPSVEAVVKAGIMKGKPQITVQDGKEVVTYRFAPTEYLKRSEAARIVMNVLKLEKRIPE